MKIIILGPAYPLRGGGMATFNERLAMEFAKGENKVIIYTFSLQYPGFLFPGTSQYSNEPPPTDLDIRVCINSVNPLNWIRVGSLIKKEKADFIIVRYWLPFMGPCLGTILRMVKRSRTYMTKIICLADNIIPHEKRPGDTLFTRYFIKPIDGFITMSQKVRDDLGRFTTTKPVRLVTHPLYDNFGEKVEKSLARRELQLGENPKIILFFGFIRPYKGLDFLLEAIKILKDRNGNSIPFKLLVAGEFYEDRAPYDLTIQNFALENNVILRTDFIPDNLVKYYLSACDVLVQPYKNATQSGVTPLAYQFDKPMIVTRVGGLPSLVPEGVGLIAEPNAVSIADKIVEYFEKGEDYFLPGIQEEKKKLSWEVLTGAILGLGREL